MSRSKVINCSLYSIRSWNYNKLRGMRLRTRIGLLLLGIVFYLNPVSAQYDDLYYDPAKDALPPLSADFYDGNAQTANADREVAAYDDQAYEYDLEEDGYHYSSRIRRFHRPVGNYDYYSPAYTESSFYDNCAPGRSIYMSGAFAHSYFSPFYGPGFSFGFGIGFGSPAYNPWGWGNPYNPWGWGNPYNPWGWNPYFGARPPFYGYGHCPVYYTNNYNYFYNSNPRGYSYGPRNNVTSVGTRDGRNPNFRRGGVPDPGPSVTSDGSRRSVVTADPSGTTRRPSTSTLDPNANTGNPRVNTIDNGDANRVPASNRTESVGTLPDNGNNVDRISADQNSSRYTRTSLTDNSNNSATDSERTPATTNPRYMRDTERTRTTTLDRSSRDRSARANTSRSSYTRESRTFDRNSYERPKRSERSFTPYNRTSQRRYQNSGSSSPYLRDRSSTINRNAPSNRSPRTFERPRTNTSNSRFSPNTRSNSTNRSISPSRSSGSRTPSAMPRSSSGSRSSGTRSSGSRSSSRRGG